MRGVYIIVLSYALVSLWNRDRMSLQALVKFTRSIGFSYHRMQYHELAAEAFYLMAIAFDKPGQLEERYQAATSFQKHVTALKNIADKEDHSLEIDVASMYHLEEDE